MDTVQSLDDEDFYRASVLDDLGAEVTGIAFPVSVCMALTIALVRLLHGGDDGERSQVYIAEVYYSENEDDTNTKKLTGSLLNALIFVGVITIMTFVIVLLFKYGCIKFIYAYMGFATFLIFFFMTGGIIVDVTQATGLHIDSISLGFMLYNFAIVGPLILFFQPAPLFLKQVYLMWTGVVVAFVFTAIPSWTTWVLLVAMALYDLFAVLTPQGPLQMLVNMAMERDQEIPALVYEAREVRRRPRPRSRESNPVAPQSGASQPGEPPAASNTSGPVAEGNENDDGMFPQFEDSLQHRPASDTREAGDSHEGSHAVNEPLVPEFDTPADLTAAVEDVEGPQSRSSNAAAASSQTPTAEAEQRRMMRRREVERSEGEDDDPYKLGLPSGVKLGLGDFIFYSVLVGRASIYDWMTVYTSFISVIAGLGITLWLLAVAKKALPALPVSIFLGMIFYFLTRLTLEPFIVPAFVTMAYW